MEVAGACGCVAPGDVEFLAVDTDERGVNAAVGVCRDGENAVRKTVGQPLIPSERKTDWAEKED